MKTVKCVLVALMLIVAGLCRSVAWAQTPRWPEQKANAWYAQQPWLMKTSPGSASQSLPQQSIPQLRVSQQPTAIA